MKQNAAFVALSIITLASILFAFRKKHEADPLNMLIHESGSVLTQPSSISFASLDKWGNDHLGKIELEENCKRQVDSLTALVQKYRMMLEKNQKYAQQNQELAQKNKQVAQQSMAELQRKLTECQAQIKK